MKRIYALLVAMVMSIGLMWADVTFTSGTKITFDATAYGSGMNIFIPGNASPACTSTEWWSSTSSVITFTLTSDWTVKTSTGLFKSSGSGWSTVSASTLPTDATYTILTVNSDGKTYSWSAPASDPTVTLSVSATKVEPGTEITLTAEASNFTGDVAYTYSYATDGENFTELTGNTHTPETAGTYTYKVVATAGEQTASATKTVTVANVTYTVVGASTDLFGTAWAPSLTDNDMTKQADGTYKWEKTDVVLAVGSYEYKIATDHAWTNPSYPSEGNASFSISEAAIYTVTITFNSSTKKYDATATKTGTAEKDVDCYLAGEFTSWGTNQIKMTMSDDKSTYTTTVNFAEAKSHEFKIIEGTSWMGNTGTMTRDNCSGWTMSSSVSGNCTLTVDFPGDYIFTYTIEDHKLSVTYPANSVSLSISDACTDDEKYYATFSSTIAFKIPEGVTVSEIGVTDGKLTVQNYATDAVVPANTGVMVSASAGGSYTVNLSNEAGTSVLGTDNLLRPTGEGIDADGMTAKDADCLYYRLTMHNGTQIGYYWGAENGVAFDYTTPNRAYLAVPTAQAGSTKISFWFGDDDTTGIDLTTVLYQGEGVGKYFENGQIVVVKNGKKFNSAGQAIK